MYADAICVMAQTAIALQKLFDVCYEYGITNILIYNPLKSVCMVFKPGALSISSELLKLIAGDFKMHNAHNKSIFAFWNFS